MTEVTLEQRLALVEYVSHLSAKDYEATLVDLVELGFVSPDLVKDPAKRNIVAPLLGSVLEQLSQVSLWDTNVCAHVRQCIFVCSHQPTAGWRRAIC
jgi:hypothetical protein